MSYFLARSGLSREHRNLRAFCVLDINGDAVTYVKARHFNKRRSRTKAISLGSPIEAVRHGSEMFALIAGDGSFNVVKSNGRIVRNVQPASPGERVIGASILQDAYVFLREDGYVFSGGRDISGGQLDKSGETISGFDMTHLMGRSVVDVVSTDNAFVALLDEFFVAVPTRKGVLKGDNSNL